ncbi:MAG: hypothetical protein WC061_06720 [Melioribacteraceae bacterium]
MQKNVTQKVHGLIFFSILFSMALVLIGCGPSPDDYIAPVSRIVKVYKSPGFDSYRLNKIALAPMMNDDTTDFGTLYSTNHFLNSLEQNFEKTKFFIPELTESSDPDSLIPWIAESIEEVRHLDLKYFSDTDLGYTVLKDSADAVFIGLVHSVSAKKGNSFSRVSRRFFKSTLISCDFTYYLVSLKDGRVLLKFDMRGEEGFYLNLGVEIYPELDTAISNGIDKIIEVLPFE